MVILLKLRYEHVFLRRLEIGLHCTCCSSYYICVCKKEKNMLHNPSCSRDLSGADLIMCIFADV